MRIVAVVTSYWPERVDNVMEIVRRLGASTRRPDVCVVLDNGGLWRGRKAWGRKAWERGSLELAFGGPVEVVDAGNTRCRGKFVVGLLWPADFYLLLDDDTAPGPAMIETLSERCATPSAVTGYWGVQIVRASPGGSWTFHGGRLVGPETVDRKVEVDAFHGRYIWAHWRALVNMLAEEETIRLGGSWSHEGDDLLIGLANRPFAVIVPLRGDELPVDLSEQGVGMCHAPGYFEQRDQFLNEALAAMGTDG